MREKTALLLQLILEKSAAPEGFFTLDARPMNAEKNAAMLCRKQVEAGTLFRVRAGQTMYAYFQKQSMASAYLKRRQEAVLAKAASNISFAPKLPKPVKCSAEIVHTAQTRYSSRPWIDLRAVSVPRLSIGQPGWSMSI